MSFIVVNLNLRIVSKRAMDTNAKKNEANRGRNCNQGEDTRQQKCSAGDYGGRRKKCARNKALEGSLSEILAFASLIKKITDGQAKYAPHHRGMQ